MNSSAASTLNKTVHQALGFVPENMISIETLQAFSEQNPGLNAIISDYEQRTALGEDLAIYLLADNQLYMGPPTETLFHD
jgi:hypothetical protein